MDKINILAVFAAAVSSFLLGGLWYSKKFLGAIWNREAGRTDMQKGGHPAKVFGLSFLFALIGAFGFACWLGPEPDYMHALEFGAIVGACFVATSFGINYQFANRSFLMWLIDAGYHFLQFVIYGFIIGHWH